jgi:hypothetical protein
VENGLNPESYIKVFKEMGAQEKEVDVRNFVELLLSENIGRDVVVALLRDIGLSDMLITKVFSYERKEAGV